MALTRIGECHLKSHKVFGICYPWPVDVNPKYARRLVGLLAARPIGAIMTVARSRIGGSGARPLVSTRSMWLFSSTLMVTGVRMPNSCEEITEVNVDHGEIGDVLTIGVCTSSG